MCNMKYKNGEGEIVNIIMVLQPFIGPWLLFWFLDAIHSR
jgi:hypothetical protein